MQPHGDSLRGLYLLFCKNISTSIVMNSSTHTCISFKYWDEGYDLSTTSNNRDSAVREIAIARAIYNI